MAQRYPADSNKEISKKLGSTWKNLDVEQKNKYFDKAREIDMEHKRKYPSKCFDYINTACLFIFVAFGNMFQVILNMSLCLPSLFKR